MATVLSDQTREWLYHPHYISSDLTPASDIHKFSHIQLSYSVSCKRKQRPYKHSVTKHRPPGFSWTRLIYIQKTERLEVIMSVSVTFEGVLDVTIWM